MSESDEIQVASFGPNDVRERWEWAIETLCDRCPPQDLFDRPSAAIMEWVRGKVPNGVSVSAVVSSLF